MREHAFPSLDPPPLSLSASLPITIGRPLAPSGPALPQSNPRKAFSYKTHFKRAYLTESAWLRGPGRELSTQQSADDGVVTSLGFDGEWIVVGMATSKVHIFEAGAGGYVKTLDGHELGVWCLTLVSKGGGPRELDEEVDVSRRDEKARTPERRPRTSKASATDDRSFTNDSPTANSKFFRHPCASASAAVPSATDARSTEDGTPRQRRRSFDGVAGGSRPAPSSRTGGMGLGAGGETGDSSQQAGVCGTARGYGQPGAIVVSGGCDRDVRVWDVETGLVLPPTPHFAQYRLTALNY